MRKLKLLFAACALFAGGMTASAQTDVTSTYITNPGFDDSNDFQNENIGTASNGRKDVTGWSNTGSGSYNAGGAIGFGTTGTINGASLPANNSDGSATGGALTLNTGWGSSVFYSQDITLPAGNYTLTFKVNNVGQNAKFLKDPVMFSFSTTTGASFSGNVHSYPANTWTTQTITYALASETQGTIKIGYKDDGSGGSGGTPKLIVDYVKALYNSNYTETLQSTIDRATILNARASDSDLAAAITTAQGVLDGADNTIAYQATIDNAVTALRDAISTAQAKVVLLEGENITFILENADFESSTPVTGGITTYDYDAATNGTSFSRMQIVEGWTIAENGNAKSAGVFKFGENPFLGSTGTQYQAPSSASATGEEKALGIVAVWSSSAQYKQNVTLPAGSYIIEVPVYNTAGTTAFSKNLIGFVENGGTEHLATAKTYATGSWTTEKIIFELENETSGYMSLGYTAANSGSAAMPHLFIDYVKVTYTSPIAAAYQKYQDALAAAQAAIANTDYNNVTGDERTALQNAIDATPETTKEAYNNAADALDTARETFTNAKSAYDAFVAAKATTVPDLAYAATAKKTALEEAIAATATTAEEANTKAADITTALRAYYESNALAEGVTGAVNMTNSITNAANPSNTSGWTLTNTTGNSNMRTMTNEPWTNSDNTTPSSYFDTNSWGTAFATTMKQDVTLEAGTYLLSVMARGNGTTTYQLTAKDNATDITAIGSSGGVFGRGWNSYTVVFEVTEDEVGAAIGMNMETGSSSNWLSFGNFQLVQLSKTDVPMATAQNYADLANAINDAESHTLGFEANEYAPYNNIAALEALATAKEFDTSVDNRQKLVVAATTALTNATWTPNADDVDAIYNGNFSSDVEGDWGLTAWTRTNAWGQQQTGLSGNYTTAYYNQPGSLQYGNQGVYTMPLAANTVYELTFAYRSHENNSNQGVKASVLKGEDGLAATNFEANGSTSEWKVATKLFKTGAAGNYVLTLENTGNTWMTGVSLVKADVEEVTISENVDYEPSDIDFANVTLNRAFSTSKWNTLSLPFDITNEELKATFGDGVQVAECKETANGDESTIDFSKMTTPAITANTPVLLKPAVVNANNEYEFANRTIAAGDAIVSGTNFDFVGTYAASVTIDKTDYFISGDKLWRSTGATTIKGTRAYLKAKSTEGGEARIVSFNLDGGETTAIMDIERGTITTGNVYNTAGQLVKKAQKGIYIQNGKKVVVK